MLFSNPNFSRFALPSVQDKQPVCPCGREMTGDYDECFDCRAGTLDTAEEYAPIFHGEQPIAPNQLEANVSFASVVKP